MDLSTPAYVDLDDNEVLWRRVPDWHVVPDGSGGWRASSGAFCPHSADGLMSVYRSSETVVPRALLVGQEGTFYVAGFQAGCLRDLGLRIFPDRESSSVPGHYQIEGSKKKTRRLANESFWVIAPPQDFIGPK